jgi:hypothetical protein
VTEVQAAAIAAANERMRPAQELLANRNRLFYLVCRIEPRDLDRLTGVLNALLAADPSGSLLKRVATYAEGLAEWYADPVESPDAQNSKG